MRCFQYYFKVLRVAFSHSLSHAQDIIFLLFILGGFITYFLPRVHMAIDVTGWQIAAVVLSCIVGSRLFMAPYWIYKADQEKIKGFESKLALTQGSRAILKVGEPRFYQYEQTTTFHWRVNVINDGPASANNVQVSLCNINPPPISAAWHDDYPYPLVRTGLTLDSPTTPINSHDSQGFDLFMSYLNHVGGRFVLLDTKSHGQNPTYMEEGERWELTYKITSENSDPVIFSLELHIQNDTLIVERKGLSVS
jgi:hypothetical protein